MWAAWVVAAIALAAAAFMLRFLMALLREGAPSVCYWVVPVRREPEKEKTLKFCAASILTTIAARQQATVGDYRLELMENEHHAEEKCASDLIALDVRPVSDNVGWRPIQPSTGNAFRGHAALVRLHQQNSRKCGMN